MTRAVPDILARIVDRKRVELAHAPVPLDTLARAAEAHRSQRRDFMAALRSPAPAVIAEIKKASPSKGPLTDRFDPAGTAVAYEAGGAAALSVLTDRDFFAGSLDDLETARAQVGIPLLRKDFTIAEYHVYEAAARGADAILLIAAILSERELIELREVAEGLGLAALVEVHDAEELSAAAGSGARIIGVNNRNLHTFQVTLDTSLDLADRIPSSAIRVSESGIHGPADVQLLQQAGYQAFLVGEHLMRSGNPRRALEALRQ